MKLERMHLLNFRCFEDLTIEFHDKLTVIVAENGAGKTALLDAVALGFGRYLSKLPGVKGQTTKETDLRVAKGERRAPFLRLAWEARALDGGKLVWSGGRRRDAAVSMTIIKRRLAAHGNVAFTRDLKAMDDYAVRLIDDELEGRAFFLPVIAYYGTNRAIREEVQRRRGFRKSFSRFDALEGALDPDSRFRSAFEWFNAMEDEERREQVARKDFDYRHPALQAVKGAIVGMLPPGVSKPRTEIRPLRFVVDRLMPDGTSCTLRIGQLSDGYRVMLGLVMDLARRLAQANPVQGVSDIELITPLGLPAIALIDEVDLHLHPNWQQRVLADLQRTFPGTQFIVTTHSPQVLTSVDAACIRSLVFEPDPETGVARAAVQTVTQQTLGVASSDLLAEIMGVNPIPDVKQAQWVSDYHALIQQNLHLNSQGVVLRRQLEAHFGANHPVLRESDRLIRLQAIKSRLPRRDPGPKGGDAQA